MSAVRRGAGYFKCLKKEEEEKEGELLAARRRREEQRRAAWNPPKPSSDEESEGEQSDPENFFKTEPASFEVTGQGSETGRWSSRRKRVVPTRPFTPIHCSLLSTRLTERDAETLFRQLCVLIWLLETLTVEPPNATGSVLTCWSGRDPGGTKSSTKRINKDKAIETKWEQFVMQSKVTCALTFVSRRLEALSPLSQKVVGSTPTPPRPSPHVRTCCIIGRCHPSLETFPRGAPLCLHSFVRRTFDFDMYDTAGVVWGGSLVFGGLGAADEGVKVTVLPLPLLSLSSPTHPFSNAGRFSASKSRFSADLQSKFVEVAEEAVLSLHDSLECLERSVRTACGRCVCIACALHVCIVCAALGHLLSRIPEGLKENPQISRALRRLSKLGDRQDLRVRSQHFLRVLSGLRDWELCSPYVSSAIEVRASPPIPPTEDYDSWLQLRVDIAKRCPSAPPPMR
uniref:Uncharacterized protein n=1 Tax=Callorhinchus milii TaxID=7868 RepID=A0A4W3HPV5_CALMI